MLSSTYPKRVPYPIRCGLGSAPTTGHQNMTAADRKSACSRACMPSSSSAASKRGLKWAAHMTPAKNVQPTTGCASRRSGADSRIGIARRVRQPRGRARSRSVTGAPSTSSGAATIVKRMCWTMCTLKSCPA